MISKLAPMRRGKYECKILEMHLKLKDQQLKIILHIYRMLHQNLVGTTNQKKTIDTHFKKKEEGEGKENEIQIQNQRLSSNHKKRE